MMVVVVAERMVWRLRRVLHMVRRGVQVLQDVHAGQSDPAVHFPEGEAVI
jgi:hypothetical protein